MRCSFSLSLCVCVSVWYHSQIAIDTNCARLNFNVLNWNTNAIEFYQSRGAIDLTASEGWHMLRVSRDQMQIELNRLK
jgi:hypothetical protein